MKLLFLTLLIFAAPVAAEAQAPGQTYKLGAREVSIPAPEVFV